MSRDEACAVFRQPPASQADIGVAVRMDIFATLQHEKERLSQSENRIADILLNDFEFAVNASIIELAGKADVSPPTVTRFCRRLGCESFSDFKVQLARTAYVGMRYLKPEPKSQEPGDVAQDIISKAQNALFLLQMLNTQINLRGLLLGGMIIGAALPSFTATYAGLVAGDTPAAVGGLLTFTTSATSSSPVGTYAVMPGGVTSGNYVIVFTPGSLTVTYAVREAYDTGKANRSGSTIPVKVQLSNAIGANASSSSVVLTAFAVVRVSNAATGEIEEAGQSNPDGNFRFTLLDGVPGYIFNLQTTGLVTGTYEMQFRASGDPTPHAVRFQIR